MMSNVLFVFATLAVVAEGADCAGNSAGACLEADDTTSLIQMKQLVKHGNSQAAAGSGQDYRHQLQCQNFGGPLPSGGHTQCFGELNQIIAKLEEFTNTYERFVRMTNNPVAYMLTTTRILEPLFKNINRLKTENRETVVALRSILCAASTSVAQESLLTSKFVLQLIQHMRKVRPMFDEYSVPYTFASPIVNKYAKDHPQRSSSEFSWPKIQHSLMAPIAQLSWYPDPVKELIQKSKHGEPAADKLPFCSGAHGMVEQLWPVAEEMPKAVDGGILASACTEGTLQKMRAVQGGGGESGQELWLRKCKQYTCKTNPFLFNEQMRNLFCSEKQIEVANMIFGDKDHA